MSFRITPFDEWRGQAYALVPADPPLWTHLMYARGRNEVKSRLVDCPPLPENRRLKPIAGRSMKYREPRRDWVSKGDEPQKLTVCDRNIIVVGSNQDHPLSR